MRKLLGLVVAVGLMFGFSGQALAAFSNNDLLITVYNVDDKEVTVDLGDLSSTAALTQQNKVLAGAGTISLDQFGEGLGWSDLSLAFYGANSNMDGYFATSLDTITKVWFTAGWTFDSGVETLYNNYKYNNTTDFYTALSSARTSYYNVIDKGTSPGVYLGLNKTDYEAGEVILENLVADGYVDMYLYHIDTFNDDLVENGDNQYAAVLRLNADGSVVLNPVSTSTVPIPASLLLFGSGLLGLFGIRRKTSN